MELLQWLILGYFHYLGRLLVLLTAPIFRWIYDGACRGLPQVPTDLLMKSGVELAAMIRHRQVTSVAVVDAFIARIKEVNPLVNAVIADRFDAARKEAAEIDRILDSDNIPDEYSEQNAPYLGVPVTTKEAISIAGLPSTLGTLARRHVKSEQDADVIVCMRRAGAIPLALTNISELCMWYESSNFIYGRTNNAYHQGRMVGGSSGGEGCILSAAGSVIGFGSDMAGSVRMPAFFNGIFGHKASPDVVSNIGHYPMPKGDACSFMSIGPMCRYAADLLPLFRLTSLPEQRTKLQLDDTVEIRRVKFYYMEDDGGGFLMTSVHPDVRATILKAARHFESLGCSVKKVAFPQLRESFDIWSSVASMSGDDTSCSVLAGGPPNAPVNPFVELAHWLVGRGRHTLPAILNAVGDTLPSNDMTEMRNSLRADMELCLGDDGVFLYPTYPVPAPFHNQALTLIFNFAYCGIFNVLGLPATAIPMGLATSERVPVGIQAIASRYCDRLTLAVAVELEKAFGGWIPPFPIS